MKANNNIWFLKLDNLMKVAMFFVFFGTTSGALFAQTEKEKKQELKESQTLLSDASLALQKEKFPVAEANYRKAIALNPTDETGKYNLGTAYYGKSKNTEALHRFKQAAEIATAKSEKHKAFHNLGNTYMNEKKYAEAVEAYKNALRNNPKDEESRYNLALAKEMLEKNPPKDDKGDDENKDQNKENENKDKDGDNKEGDNGDEKEDKDKGDEKDDNKDGDKEDEGKKDEPKENKEGEGDKPQQQQPIPGQLSPQQVKSLLEAMNNEEKKVLDKINAQKQKGAKVKSNKDW
jgi:tetratricopeptide (TPR) repeat protein